MAGDWSLSERLPGLDDGKLAGAHALVGECELAPLGLLLRAAHHLAELERRLPSSSCRDLVEEIYPSCWAPVPVLLSRAELALSRALLAPGRGLEAFGSPPLGRWAPPTPPWQARRRPGSPVACDIWEVGAAVVAPLLDVHGRVAVLVVDAMRVDVWSRSGHRSAEALPGRPLREAWAVVPEPTRTRESIAALYLGRPVAAGSGPDEPADLGPPSAHLGFEAAALVGVDRDGSARRAAGPVGDGRTAMPRPPHRGSGGHSVDAALHRSSADVASLVEEAVAGLERRVVPTLHALPANVPLVVLADHGFRENRSWGRGSASRYGHGGLSLEESVIPVATFGCRQRVRSRTTLVASPKPQHRQAGARRSRRHPPG